MKKILITIGLFAVGICLPLLAQQPVSIFGSQAWVNDGTNIYPSTNLTVVITNLALGTLSPSGWSQKTNTFISTNVIVTTNGLGVVTGLTTNFGTNTIIYIGK